jgi:hypothetical protein
MVTHIFSKGEETVNNYRVTVFQPNGEKILDEAFQAPNDANAKEQGLKILSEKDLLTIPTVVHHIRESSYCFILKENLASAKP